MVFFYTGSMVNGYTMLDCILDPCCWLFFWICFSTYDSSHDTCYLWIWMRRMTHIIRPHFQLVPIYLLCFSVILFLYLSIFLIEPYIPHFPYLGFFKWKGRAISPLFIVHRLFSTSTQTSYPLFLIIPSSII